MKLRNILIGFAMSTLVTAPGAVAETVLTHGEAGPNRGARAAALQ